MSAIVEFVVNLVAELVCDKLVERWPLVGEAVGAVFLVTGLGVALWTGTDRVPALIICASPFVVLGGLWLYRLWRKPRAAATTE